ncbi:MAG: hypothetical protein HY718_12025 [Planctomycetes bacterium]|nr:hypothetical protein [Planctomycetota bacterium]
MSSARRWMILVCLAVSLAVAVAGCGSITPTNLAIKGGTWAAKELIKKELKERRHEKEKSSRAASQPAE